MRDILIIAELTFCEARRRKILWAGLILGALFVLLYGVGFFFINREAQEYVGRGNNIGMNSGFTFVIISAFYAVSFLGVMLAVLTSVGTLSAEIQTHTIQSIAVKPLRRSAIILGKWLGLVLMLALYLALLCGGVLLVTWAISGYAPPEVGSAILLIILQAIIMITISIYGGTRLSTITNGIVAFMLYGLAFIAGWIEQIGAVMHNHAAVDIGIVISLLIPGEAMWQMASYRMHPPAIRSLGVSPFAMASSPSPAMLWYALGYVTVLLILAIRAFAKKDL